MPRARRHARPIDAWWTLLPHAGLWPCPTGLTKPKARQKSIRRDAACGAVAADERAMPPPPPETQLAALRSTGRLSGLQWTWAAKRMKRGTTRGGDAARQEAVLRDGEVWSRAERGRDGSGQAVRRMMWTPESVETRCKASTRLQKGVKGAARVVPMSLSCPTSRANEASSNGFCI